MQNKSYYLKSIRKLSLPLITMAAILFLFSSCKGKKKEKEGPVEGLACDIQFTARDIQDKWIDKKFTSPGDPNLIEIIDVVVSYDPLSKQMQVSLVGRKGDNTEVAGSEIGLFDGTACARPPYTSIPEHNYIKLSELG